MTPPSTRGSASGGSHRDRAGRGRARRGHSSLPHRRHGGIGTGPGKKFRGLPFYFPVLLSPSLPTRLCPRLGDGRETPAPGRGGTADPPLCLPARHPRPLSAPLDRPLDFNTRPSRRGRRPPAAAGRPARAERGGGGRWAAAGDGAARCRPSGGGGGEGAALFAPRREGEKWAVPGLAVESGEAAACGLRSRERPRWPSLLRRLLHQGSLLPEAAILPQGALLSEGLLLLEWALLPKGSLLPEGDFLSEGLLLPERSLLSEWAFLPEGSLLPEAPWPSSAVQKEGKNSEL